MLEKHKDPTYSLAFPDTTDQVTKWVKLPKWSGCLDLSKMPDATVPCIRSMDSQFQAENTDLPDLYTQQQRHHTIKI